MFPSFIIDILKYTDTLNQALEHYKELLTYVKSAVTRNYSEKSINNMLDFVDKQTSSKTSNVDAQKHLTTFYSLTLDSFKHTNNERLYLKTSIKLAHLHIARGDYTTAQSLMRPLHTSITLPTGAPDPSKGTYALEIYAMEIELHSALGNTSLLKTAYSAAQSITTAVPHPKIKGVICEAGGKMHLGSQSWEQAQTDFFEAFRNYDEAGAIERLRVLRYLVLTTMLMGSDISPFASQETKPYRNDPRISAMTELVDAYQREDVAAYERVLARNKEILEDRFIAENIDEVTRGMRTKAVLKVISPYSRFKLSTIADRLSLTEEEIMDILSFLIISGSVKGRINERDGVVEIEDSSNSERERAMENWAGGVQGVMKKLWEGSTGWRDANAAGGMGELFWSGPGGGGMVTRGMRRRVVRDAGMGMPGEVVPMHGP